MAKITLKHLKTVMTKAERARKAAVSRHFTVTSDPTPSAPALKAYKPKDAEAWKVFKKIAALVNRQSDAAVAHMPSRTTTQRFARVMAKGKYIQDNERRFIAEAKISPAMEKCLRVIAEDPNLPND